MAIVWLKGAVHTGPQKGGGGSEVAEAEVATMAVVAAARRRRRGACSILVVFVVCHSRLFTWISIRRALANSTQRIGCVFPVREERRGGKKVIVVTHCSN
jgi:hypothetical protein